MVSSSQIVGRRSTVSAAAFTGRAVPPAAPDPVTTKLLNQNSLQLGMVAAQIQGMNAQMQSLAGSLTVINQNLAISQNLERQKEEAEQRREYNLAQQKLREGQESAVEKKIAAASVKPASKLAQKASFTLSRVGDFLGALFGSWLAMKGVQAIRAFSEKNTSRLKEIRNETLKGVAAVAGILLVAKGGLALLAASFTAIASKIGLMITGGLIAAIAIKLTEFIKNAAGAALDALNPLSNSANNDAPTADSPGGEAANTGFSLSDLNPFSGLFGGGDEGPDLTGQGGPDIEPQTPAVEKPEGFMRGLAGLGDFLTGDIFDFDKRSKTTESEGAEVQSNQTMMGAPAPAPSGEEKSEEGFAGPDKPAAEGETSLQPVQGEGEVPSTTDDKTAPANVPLEGDPSRGLQPGQISPDDTTLSQMGYSTDEVAAMITEEKRIGKEGTITPIPKGKLLEQAVSQPPPESAPIVMMAPAPSGGEKQPKPTAPAQGGINASPAFATSNPDNIYTLGALSNFNVVMA